MSECQVCAAFAPDDRPDPLPEQMSFPAVWDTGASGSVISQRIADALGLVATGMTNVDGVHGPSQTETYLVNISLPNGVMFHGLRVTRGVLKGFDVLIGMDVIAAGDFSVSGFNGQTMLSFRVPSKQATDYVQDHHRDAARATIKSRPNAPRKKKNRRK